MTSIWRKDMEVWNMASYSFRVKNTLLNERGWYFMRMGNLIVMLRDGRYIVIKDSEAFTSDKGIEVSISENKLSVEEAKRLIDSLQTGIDRLIIEEES